MEFGEDGPAIVAYRSPAGRREKDGECQPLPTLGPASVYHSIFVDRYLRCLHALVTAASIVHSKENICVEIFDELWICDHKMGVSIILDLLEVFDAVVGPRISCCTR